MLTIAEASSNLEVGKVALTPKSISAAFDEGAVIDGVVLHVLQSSSVNCSLQGRTQYRVGQHHFAAFMLTRQRLRADPLWPNRISDPFTSGAVKTSAVVQ